MRSISPRQESASRCYGEITATVEAARTLGALRLLILDLVCSTAPKTVSRLGSGAGKCLSELKSDAEPASGWHFSLEIGRKLRIELSNWTTSDFAFCLLNTSSHLSLLFHR